jgi:hypothetical protein
MMVWNSLTLYQTKVYVTFIIQQTTEAEETV